MPAILWFHSKPPYNSVAYNSHCPLCGSQICHVGCAWHSQLASVPRHIGGGGFAGAGGSAFKVADSLGCHVDSGCQLGARWDRRLETRVPLRVSLSAGFWGISHLILTGFQKQAKGGCLYDLALEVPSCHFHQRQATFRFSEREPKLNLPVEEASHAVRRAGKTGNLIEAVFR